VKKITEKQDRKKLGEGRDYGIGFAILKKDKSKFETLNAFTACRDYLNDFTYVESTKKEIGQIYGYNHNLLNCFDKKQVFYIGVKTLHYNSEGVWNKFEECEKLLITNYKNLEKLLNILETILQLPKLTKIELDEDTLIIKAPIYWTKYSHLISIYTLLIRCFFDITNEEVENKDFLEIIETHKPFIQDDKYMTNFCKEFFTKILGDKTIFDKLGKSFDNEIKQKDLSGIVHNYGIQAFLTDLKQ